MATGRREDGGRGEFRNGNGLYRALPCPEFKLHVLFLQDSRRRDELHSWCSEYRLGVGHPVRLQEFEGLKQLWRYRGQTEFTVDFEDGVEIPRLEPDAGELVEPGSQLGHIRRWHGEAAGVRMASVAGEQVAAGLDCFQKMKSADRAARAERFVSLAGDHHGRTVVALDDASRSDADDAAMPPIAIDDDAVGVTQCGLSGEALFNATKDPAFLFLAVGVELIELRRQLPRPGRVFHAEKFDDIASNIHPASGINPRGNAEADFASRRGPVRRDLGSLQQRFESGIDRSAQRIQTERSEDPVLSRQG